MSFQTLEDDQGALAEAVEHLFACAAFDVVGEPFDLAAGVLDGVGEKACCAGVSGSVVMCCSFEVV